MAPDENIIDTRLANALVADASPSPHALDAMGQLLDRTLTNTQPHRFLGPFMSRLLPKILRMELGWFKKRQGGLWVGGKAVLSPSVLKFSPNGMNEAMHANSEQLSWTVPIPEITSVGVRRAILTDIIDIHSRSGPLSLRCFKASAFAVQIEQARQAFSQKRVRQP